MAEQQSSLSQFQQQFDDQLTCSVCLDQYTNPKTLPCHHSFCLKCIEPLPIEIKDGKHYINCPTCRVPHLLPEEGTTCLPNDFKINSLLELRRGLKVRKSSTQASEMACPSHNDPLRVYCETCCEVICRDCTFSVKHNTHRFQLISECYPEHHQEIKHHLDQLNNKTADMNMAVMTLVARETEVVDQGEEIKKQISIHAQQLIEQVQESERDLLQQVDTVTQEKRELLTKQREQAERIHTQLKTCQEMIQKSLAAWSQTRVMMEKERMVEEMEKVSQNIQPIVFQPIEEANTKLTQTSNIKTGIGKITSHRYGKAALKSIPCPPNTLSNAILTLNSFDDSPFSLSPSLILCKISTPVNIQPINCDIKQTKQGEYDINFTPSTIGAYKLIIQIGGVDIPSNPSTLPVLPLSVMKGRPTKTIGGVNMPWGITVCDNGNIVVSEWNAHCITTVNKKGKKVRSFGTEGMKEGQFMNPQGVAITNDGHVLVTDKHRLQKLPFDGENVQFNVSGKDKGGQLQFYHPMGVVVHPTTGHIFVANCHNNRIQVFNSDLTSAYTIMLQNDKTFKNPYDIALDKKGHLYVAELGNHCITKLTTTGQFITRFGSEGFAPGQLYNPSSLTINNNLVYVSECGNHRVSIFDTEGTYIHCFGSRGSGKAEFISPYGITSDANGSLYISDTTNNRIVIFE